MNNGVSPREDGPRAVLVVLAGGSGSRMGADVNKVYLQVGGRDVLDYSLRTASATSKVGEVVVVVRDADWDRACQLVDAIGDDRFGRVVVGGASRHQSEYAGLNALRADIESGVVGVVAIHDGARPFLSTALLDGIVDAAWIDGGAIPGLELGQPLFHAEGDRAELIPTDSLRRVQTPQAFRAGALLAAYDAANAAGFEGVDTAETVERFSNLDVRLVPGDPRNIKVTYGADMELAEDIAATWALTPTDHL